MIAESKCIPHRMIVLHDIVIIQDETKVGILIGTLNEFMTERNQTMHYYKCQQEYITFCAM